MPEREALDRAVYDHELEEPRARGQRRPRRVDDWGVGEEIFDRMPSRRSARGGDGRTRPRRDGHAQHRAARGTAGSDTGEHRFAREDGPAARGDRRFAPGQERRFAPEDTEGRRFAREWVDERRFAPEGTEERRFAPGDPAAERRFAPGDPAGERRFAPEDAAPVAPDAPTTELVPSIPAPVPGDTPRIDVAGRRTVVITGRPGPLGQLPTRRRPPRTRTERIGARPDRIVAWAVALGILLILIAVATANAAVASALVLPLVPHRRARHLPRGAAARAR